MSIFENLEPLEPLLWLNETPLITLDYMLHIQDNNAEKKQDLLWELIRQILIVDKYKDIYPIDKDFLENEYALLSQNEVLSRLLESNTIDKSTLITLIEKQYIYANYLKDLEEKIFQEISTNDGELKEYYENEKQFERKNVFEVFQGYIDSIIPSTTLNSLKDFNALTNNQTQWVGVFSKEELDEYLKEVQITDKQDLPLLLPIEDKNNLYLFVEQYYEKYKPHYEKIKPSLVRALAQNSIEYQLEEESQKYLENVSLKYNESALEKALKIVESLNNY